MARATRVSRPCGAWIWKRGTGELAFLLGPSGSGKTTLWSSIAGLLKHDHGSVTVPGRDPGKLHNGEAALFRLRNIGSGFQLLNSLPALTAAENAAVPLLAAGWKRKDATAAYRAEQARLAKLAGASAAAQSWFA